MIYRIPVRDKNDNIMFISFGSEGSNEICLAETKSSSKEVKRKQEELDANFSFLALLQNYWKSIQRAWA